MAETKKKLYPSTRISTIEKRQAVKFNTKEAKKNLKISPLPQRTTSVDLSSLNHFNSNLVFLHFSTFESPVKQSTKGKPLSPYFINLSSFSEIPNTSSKAGPQLKSCKKAGKLRELSMDYVLCKEKFMEKVLHENMKLGVCN